MNDTLDLQEKTQHGTELFPLMVHQPPLDDRFPIVYVHWHKELEIVIFKEGNATYTIESEQYELRDGDIFIVQPGKMHSASTHSCPHSVIYAVVFDLEALLGSTADTCSLKYIAPLVSGSYRIPALIKQDTALGEQLNACADKLITAYCEKQPFYELTVKSLLLEFICTMYASGWIETHQPAGDRDTQYGDRIKYAIKYINSNYNQEIYLAILAKEVGYSVNHLIRLFRGATGMTPLAYLNRIRLLRAADMLMRTTKSVTEISLDIGYVNISYFQKKFKTFFKLPPAQYRKAYFAYVEHLTAVEVNVTASEPSSDSAAQWPPAR